jgi:hypothetical protein
MNDKKTEKSAPKSDELFGEVIFVYSKKQAVEDGILIDFGKLENRGVVFTTNLVNSLEKTELITILLKGLSLKFERPDLIITHINGKKVYVDWNSRRLTFMLPEDY